MAASSSRKKWTRRLALWTTAIGGVVLSFFTACVVHQSAKNHLADSFQRATAERVLSIQSALTANLEVLRSVRALYAASNSVERDEFRAFVGFAFERGLALRYMSWAPRIKAEERAAFETATQAEGYPYFHIMELLNPIERITAARRSEYFPVYFTAPDETTPVVLGFDLASEPARLEALIRARDVGKLTVTRGIVLLGDVSEPAVMAVVPIYRNKLPHETVEQRRAALQGFAVAGFRIEDILSYALHLKPGAPLPAMEILDVSEAGTESALYRSAAWPSAPPAALGWLEERGTVALGGRTWLIHSAEPLGRLSKKVWFFIVGVFCLGVLMTFLLVAYLYLIVSRADKIEQAVISRTEVLSRMNEELKKNIAERERAEKQKHESEQRYKDLIQNAPDPIAALSLNGTIEAVNPAAEQAIGYTDKELIGQHFATLPLLHGPSRRRALKEFVLVTAGRKRVPFELQLARKDGQMLTFEVNPSLIKHPDGHGIGIQVIFREMTNRKQMEQALIQREHELREKTTALENSLRELAYREKIMHSLLDDLQETNRRLALQQQSLQQVHYSLEKSHEELKSTQLQLIQAAKLESVGRLAAGVAHEVKNPLAIILMGATYLEKHIGNGQGAEAEVLRDITDAVRRADNVIKGLLEFSASKELTVHLEDVHAVIEQSLLLVKHELNKTHVEVNKLFAQDLPKVNLDRSKMEQVFINLFTNASHAMALQGKGLLTVRTSLRVLNAVGQGVGQRREDAFRLGEEAIVVEVEDTGSGIPEDKVSKVFDPFFTTKSPGQGTGLGLSVTKSIVDLHHAVIRLGNRPEGGARVTLLLHPER